MSGRVVVGVAGVLIVVAYAALSVRWVGHEPGWYAALARPSWQPPDVVFGVMWPLNFLALAGGFAGIATWGSRSSAAIALALLVLSSGLALGWAYAFYVPHHLALAAALLSAACLVTWGLVVVAGQQRVWLGAVLVPYAVWLAVASALAWAYARLN